jgi:DtxR family transcriptional regulator, manganese transport regulator
VGGATRAASPPELASRHATTRAAHVQETAEDYCELIAQQQRSQGEARVVDLARCLGVSHVTVVRTIARLKKQGLVDAKPYRSLFLTPAGERLAGMAARRHDVVVAFLRAVGVSDAAAQADAEGIEHHVGKETLAAMDRFVQKSRGV